MLEHGLQRTDLAQLLDAAVDTALDSTRTPDRGGTATTAEFGDAVVAALAGA